MSSGSHLLCPACPNRFQTQQPFNGTIPHALQGLPRELNEEEAAILSRLRCLQLRVGELPV